ncbi:hypothetical protein Ciccas_007580 [Cichlidogyrus casuarinus]|uniref:Bestrophin homolog n=1 Tax=Cichlidogyrus casuarinus TaxID=1844966 RepID=A0ABD2Q3W1_9PLAT
MFPPICSFTKALRLNVLKDSIWSKMPLDLLLFLLGYYILANVYLGYIAVEATRLNAFIRFVESIQDVTGTASVGFMFGFFFKTVMNSWSNFNSKFPDITSFVSVIIVVKCRDKAKKKEPSTPALVWDIRYTYCRFVIMAWIFTMLRLSHAIKKRFEPKESAYVNHISEEFSRVRLLAKKINSDPVIMETFGVLITQSELMIMEDLERKEGFYMATAPWLPLRWGSDLTDRALELNLVVYGYFISLFFSHQYVKNPQAGPPWQVSGFEVYLPWSALVKLVLYTSWFKMGLSLVNPLKEETSSFPTNKILDRSIRILRTIGLEREHFTKIPQGSIANREAPVGHYVSTRTKHAKRGIHRFFTENLTNRLGNVNHQTVRGNFIFT